MTDKRLTMGARVCYALLDDYAGLKGKCWPRQATVAERLGYSTRQVKRWIAELVAVGWIRARRTLTGNHYRLAWSVPENNAPQKAVPTEGTTRIPRCYEPGQRTKRDDSNSVHISQIDPNPGGMDVDDARDLIFWAAGVS